MKTEIDTFPPYYLRRFIETDLDKVMNINMKCLPENYASSFFLDLYKTYPETFLVAEIDGEVAGYIMCRVESGFSELNRFKFAKKGHVVSIAVLSNHRRKGLGVALMIASMKGMVKYGCGECYLEVRESNQSAIGMYQKLGFRILRKINGYYFDGENATIMGMKLPMDTNVTGFSPSRFNMEFNPN